MQSSGFLAPPITPDTRTDKQKLLWTTAYNRIERFLPGFLNEVIPTPAPPKAEAPAPPKADAPAPASPTVPQKASSEEAVQAPQA